MRYTFQTSLDGRVRICTSEDVTILIGSDDRHAHKLLVGYLQVGDITPIPKDVREDYRTATMHAQLRDKRGHRGSPHKGTTQNSRIPAESVADLPF